MRYLFLFIALLVALSFFLEPVVVLPLGEVMVDYSNCAEIVITNNTDSAVNGTPTVVMLTPFGVSGHQADGDDVRVIHYDGSSTYTDVDRVYAFESVVFKLQESLSANSRSSDDYFLYWGNGAATSPNATLANIYDDDYLFTGAFGSRLGYLL